MSAGVASGTVPMTSSVCGEMTSIFPLPSGSTHSPPMKSLSRTSMSSSKVTKRDARYRVAPQETFGSTSSKYRRVLSHAASIGMPPTSGCRFTAAAGPAAVSSSTSSDGVTTR